MADISPLPWLKLFPSDHVAATRSLTLAERGALIDLMCFAWMQGKLPKDEKRLAAMIGASPTEFKAIWPAIRGNFRAARGGGWTHPEIEAMRQASLEQRAAARAKAQKAANVRHHPESANRESGPRKIADILAGPARASR